MSSPLSILSLAQTPSSPYLSSWGPHQLPTLLSGTLLFCLPRPHAPPRFRNRSSKSSRIPVGSRGQNAAGLEEDAGEEVEGESEEEEDDDDEDEDEDIAAEEYDYVPDLSEDDEDDENDEDDVVLPSWSGESKRTRIERLRGVARELGAGVIDADELASIYNFRIDKFQRLAVEAFLRGSSVVVSAPTSSGKTLIAEAAAVAIVARGRRIFYTTPLKALSNQKFRDFREAFGDENVGLLTGDSVINKEAQVLVMTTEILRNMMYRGIGMASSESALFGVDAVVLDEVHYLSDMSRGTVWEEIVIYCPKEIQLICLSATVKNPDELAGWINEVHGKTELVTSLRRPVPLTWHFSTKADLFPLLEEKGKRMNRRLSLNYLQLHASRGKSYKDDTHRRRTSGVRRGYSDNDYDNRTGEFLSKNDASRIRRSLVPLVIDTVLQLRARDMLPAVWFIFNRKGCDVSVQYLEGCQLLDECEKSEVELALKRFSLQNPDAVREPALKGLLKGVAAHHAGCLPLWKTFIEELFQRGLIKVVFATETLAAGINMPARTAVISSISRRIGNGRTQLSPNELLQMAGRAGRRGIDERGHVVMIQTPIEGAEECCKLLFSGLEPLVSQFTASYGMVLNLLAGDKITRRLNESDGMKDLRSGRTLEGARKLVEQSFGTYLGSNVMIASKEELSKIEQEIEVLTSEISDEVIDRKSRQLLSAVEYREMAELQKQLKAELYMRMELRRERERKRLNALKLVLNEMETGHLPFICLRYEDSQQVEQLVSALFLGKADSVEGSKLNNMILLDDSFAVNSRLPKSDSHVNGSSEEVAPCYYVALGSDNSWYLFTEKWIKNIYKTGFPNTAFTQGDASPLEAMWMLLDRKENQWEKLAYSEHGGLWYMEGSLETWSWSLNVPVLNSLLENDQVIRMSKSYEDAARQYREQRLKVSRLKKKIASSAGYKEHKRIIDLKTCTEDKIRRLKARAKRLTERMNEIEPSGWKEFLSISNIVHESRALDINTQVIFPLGETAAAIRGENELWLAMVLRSRILLDLKPVQLAAVCASIVSEGIKVRPSGNNTYMYEPSAAVVKVINFLDDQRCSLLQLQEKHRVHIPCCLDSQFSGMVEAWASGLTWKEMMMECAMDEGDLSRLLRRTIDLLVQVPKLPDIDPVLQSNANIASNIMDRPPISDLAG